MTASGCSAASLSMIGRTRSRFGPTRRRAVAREVTRRGAEVAGPDRRDRSRELRLELRRVVAREQPRDGLVGSLEEYVCDLDRLGSCPERRERIDESLERVLLVDDVGRRALLEPVRLVVDDQRLPLDLPEGV